MSDDLLYLSAVELAEAYRSARLSPVEVARAVAARIDATHGPLNAFCHRDHPRALKDAEASEARWREGRPLGPLDGVPVSIKDVALTKGWPTLRGSRTVDRFQKWEEDAPSTARLREAGAVLIGKTTTPEFGWKGVTDGPLTGITRNPWNTDLTPGGSSGGAAAALAAGIGPLATGTDGGGSIRIPAGMTGVFGLKPTFGRVPHAPPSPFGTLAHLGPMSRTVTDAAIMLGALTRPDARDPLALPYDDVDYRAALHGGVRGLRVAFSAHLGYVRVEPEVAAIVASAVSAFEELGAIVEAADPGFDNPQEAFRTLWYAGAASLFRTISAAKRRQVEPALMEIVTEGEGIEVLDYLAAERMRFELGQRMAAFHARFDLLLTPTLPITAFAAGREVPEGWWSPRWFTWTPFTYPFNLTRQPAASVPCGFTAAGLPVGLQIVGPLYSDALVLRAARAFEIARPWSARRPELHLPAPIPAKAPA
jgi:aspartyl-tRNA(Asn)/glutamyl-tRNA(Gln) amidotransferase subunit A